MDVSGIQDIQAIGVRGALPPLNWNQDFNLTDEDQDMIYTSQIVIDNPYKFVELKFVKNGGEYELDGQPNRRVYFDESKTTEYRATFDKK